MTDKVSTLPHSHEAEQAVLGGILVGAARGDDLLGLVPLEVDDFYDPRHRHVFSAMRNLEAAERPIDLVTLADELGDKLEPIGGYPYLAELALRVPTPDRVEEYAKCIRDHRVERVVALRLGDLIEQVKRGDVRGDDAVNAALEAMRSVEVSKPVAAWTFAEAAAHEATALFRDVDRIAAGEKVYTGMPTGYRQLDEHIGGIPFEVLSLAVARPAMGKTSFATELCRNAAEHGDDTPILVSLEDGKISFGQRELAARSGVSTQDIRRRALDSERVRAVSTALNRGTAHSPLLLHLPGCTVDEVIRAVRQVRLRPPRHLQRKTGTIGKLVVIDYVSKLARPQFAVGASAEYMALSYASLALSDFAAKEGIAVLALQQLNRKLADRDSKLPETTDIRGSGRLEEDAKLILGLHWPRYYDSKEDPHDYRVVILKNHNGEANRVAHLWADMSINTIADSQIDALARRARRTGRAA